MESYKLSRAREDDNYRRLDACFPYCKTKAALLAEAVRVCQVVTGDVWLPYYQPYTKPMTAATLALYTPEKISEMNIWLVCATRVVGHRRYTFRCDSKQGQHNNTNGGIVWPFWGTGERLGFLGA